VKGSFTGPNTLVTRPRRRFLLSRISAPLDGVNSERTRRLPSWPMFSTTPSLLVPPRIWKDGKKRSLFNHFGILK